MTKLRSNNYEPKVKLSGTLEDMISISTTGAGAKPKKKVIKKSK